MTIQPILLTLLSILAFVAGKCFYNVFLHPLRGYPGPLFARATRVYNLYWDIKGLSHWKTKELHEKYGHVVRIAPDELSYTNGEAWQAIYGFPNKDGTGNFEKDAKWWNKTISGVENILTADDINHRRMRRLQNHAFSERALQAQESVVTEYCSLLIERLQQQVSETTEATIDISAWYNFIMFDVIGDLAFGEPFYCLQDAKLHWWLHAVFDIFKAGTYLRAARRFPSPLLQILLLLIPKGLLETRHSQFNFSVERVKKRLKSKTDRPDFMSYVLKASDGNAMSTEEMFVGAQVFIAAGSETTASGLCGATYFLLERPSTLETLSAEVRYHFRTETEITFRSTARLPYLNSVISEALRLFPPGPGTFPRTVPQGGVNVCGRFVPGGYTVGVHQLSTNRSSLNFRDPDSFVPERWLSDSAFEDDQRSACQPFSFGPRNCIGKGLALAEMKLILARIIWNFDMQMHSEARGWPERQKMFTTWQKDELKVKLSLKA